MKALKGFLRNVDTNNPIPDTLLQDGVTYDLFGLHDHKRQAGLRAYDDLQLYSLAFMQRSCGFTHGQYGKFKPYIESEVTEEFK